MVRRFASADTSAPAARSIVVPKECVRDRGSAGIAPVKTHGPRVFGVGESEGVAGQGQEAVEEL